MWGQRSSSSRGLRKHLNLVIAVVMLGAALVLVPTMKDRFPVFPPESRDVAAAVSGVTAGGGGETPAAFGLPPGREAGSPPGGSGERWQEQAALVQGELLAREERVAAREAALRGHFLTSFWQRQAAASAATLAIVLITVVWLLRRALRASGLQRELRAAEDRLRVKELAVLSALEELETTLAARPAVAPQVSPEREPPPVTEREMPLRPAMAQPVAAAGEEAREADAGPWTEAVHRARPRPVPAGSGDRGGSSREQARALADEGWSEEQIAGRLRLSRDEVRLALALRANDQARLAHAQSEATSDRTTLRN